MPTISVMSEEAELDVLMKTSEDAKTITLEISSETVLTVNDLIIALEGYLTELIRAYEQKSARGVLEH